MKALSIRTKTSPSELAKWTLQGLVAGIFFTAGIAQLVGVRAEVLLFSEIGLGQWLRVATGIIQVAGAISLVSTRAASVAGATLSIIIIGAVVASFTVLAINPVPLIAVGVLSSLVAVLRRDTLADGGPQPPPLQNPCRESRRLPGSGFFPLSNMSCSSAAFSIRESRQPSALKR